MPKCLIMTSSRWLKKFSGKFESFVHKLIKKQPYRDFLIQIFWNISAPGKYPWFDTKATPTQAPKSFTSTLHFNHPWLRIEATDGRSHVFKRRMVEVTCRSEGFWGLRGSSACDGCPLQEVFEIQKVDWKSLTTPRLKCLLYRNLSNLN